MISFLSLLQETALTDEQLKYVSRIGTSADRLQVLINDSLELVSAETGTLPIKVTGINLKKLITELKKEYQPQLDQKNMTLEVDLASEDVRADASALRSVLSRLLDNAIKFGFEKSAIEFGLSVLLAFTFIRYEILCIFFWVHNSWRLSAGMFFLEI